MLMPGRKYQAANSSKPRYGFNGKENDNEVKGEGNHQDYGMRPYDVRICRLISVDPLTKAYPWYTPYQFAGNKPIACVDLLGQQECSVDMVMTRNEDLYFQGKITGDELLQRHKEQGAWGAITGIAVADVFLTKGRITGFLFTSAFLGHLYHNGTNNPVEQKKRADDLTNDLVGLGTGYVIGKGVQGIMLLAKEAKILYNFGSKALGEMGEEALARQYGTIKPSGKGSSMRTSLGVRKPDGIPIGSTVNNTKNLFESKVGFQKYSGDIINQVAKDAELLAQGKVDQVTWVFYRSPSTGKIGASDDLLKELQNAGIKTQIAGDIPKDILDKTVKKYGATPKN